MNQVLRKRLLRDLRKNIGRYAALFLLFVMGIYLVVSIVGSAEMVLQGTERQKTLNCVEDGQFSLFLPLSERDLDKLTEDGTEIEPMFSLDLKSGDATLRLFKNREHIDLVQLDEGKLPAKSGEAAIEKGYADVHSLHVGDTVTADGYTFTITGIGSVPDYDMCIAKFSDTAVWRETFGLLFVTAEQYDAIRDSSDLGAEAYTYAYRLGNTTDDALKEQIKKIEITPDQVQDRFFREMVDDVLSDREELEDGVDELADGAKELSDGLHELADSNADLQSGADAIFAAYLRQVNWMLAEQGITLTKDDYAQTLDALIAQTQSQELAELKEGLDSVAQFRDGIYDYTDGTKEAAKGAKELAGGVGDLQAETGDLLDEVFDLDIENLTSFVTASDNIRIAAAAGDVIMDKNVGLIAGVIVLALFAYVVSVFVVHQIEQEQSVIGALYALGVKKNDLMRHYITMPTLVAFVAGLVGTALAFSPIGIGMQVQDTYSYFSIPVFAPVYPLYLIAYAVVMPAVICAVVNAFVINQKLSRTALSLMKNEQSAGSYKQFDLHVKSFPRLFAIRQLVRESRSAVTMVLGMLVSLMVVIMGIDCFVMCKGVQEETVQDTTYGYQYLYKYPSAEVPEGGEAAYLESLTTDCMGYTLDVTVLGVDKDNPYFDAKPEAGKNKAVINDALHERFGYKVGDRVTFHDAAADVDYSFTVTGISDYSVGFMVFMDIDSMRELFGQDEDHYNVVYSDKALDIEEGRLYSTLSREDVERTASVFVELMSSLVTMLIVAGVIIFCVVMYLMMGVMIDRSTMGISLIKIFGYRPGEIRSLYLNGNFLIVAVGALVSVPVSKLIMDRLYPGFVANVACSMKLAFPWYLYVMIYAAVLVIYFVINRLLVGKINRISPVEILKNRE